MKLSGGNCGGLDFDIDNLSIGEFVKIDNEYYRIDETQAVYIGTEIPTETSFDVVEQVVIDNPDTPEVETMPWWRRIFNG